MTVYIALLRGINVGGHNKLPMKALTVLLEKIGCIGVKTYIQSGNVIFQSEQSRKALSEAITQAIATEHGFDVPVLLLKAEELEAAAAQCPFPTEDGKALHAYFMANIPPQPDLETLTGLKIASEDFQLLGKVFYLYAPDGIGRSKLAAKAEKCLGVAATARNWNTVQKLLGMLI